MAVEVRPGVEEALPKAVVAASKRVAPSFRALMAKARPGEGAAVAEVERHEEVEAETFAVDEETTEAAVGVIEEDGAVPVADVVATEDRATSSLERPRYTSVLMNNISPKCSMTKLTR